MVPLGAAEIPSAGMLTKPTPKNTADSRIINRARLPSPIASLHLA
jgi:hypothetical protein